VRRPGAHPAAFGRVRRAALGGAFAGALGGAAAGCGPGAAGAPRRAFAPAAAPTDAATQAAAALVAATAAPQRAALARPLDDTARTQWFFVPRARPGVPIGAMSPAQQGALERLVRTGLSDAGWARAEGIIAHERILRALEQERGVPGFARRDPALYYAVVFGTPAPDSAWGWRFEGHHLSVNATAVGDQAPAVAPLFMGANPARVPSGPRAGLRLFAAEEDSARALLLALPPALRRAAVIADTTFGEIVTRNDPAVGALAPQGALAADMPEPQQRQLRSLVELYARRMAPAVARSQLARIDAAGFGRLRFAWAGGAEPGRRHYYRVHGPTVLVEYDNSQNGGNHVHTVWRDLENDFGRDLLREHYARHRHGR
jgi:hypothetical protein